MTDAPVSAPAMDDDDDEGRRRRWSRFLLSTRLTESGDRVEDDSKEEALFCFPHTHFLFMHGKITSQHSLVPLYNGSATSA